MTTYRNRKFDFSVEASRIEPGSSFKKFGLEPPYSNLFDQLPEPYWFVEMQGKTLVISDELFQRYFVREPAVA